MNGTTALKYARSRNAEGDEGTDLARSKRQQQIIIAIKDQLLQTTSIKDIKTVLKVIEILQEEVETDLTEKEKIVIARQIFDSKENMHAASIPQEFFETPAINQRYDNLYVFIPVSGDWKQLQDWVACGLESTCSY